MLVNFVAASGALSARARHPARFLRIASGAATSVVRWLEWRRQLRALSDVDDHLLRDIGLSREDVERVCSRPFWKRRSAFLLSGLLIASGATEAMSQKLCKPSLSLKASGHSDVVNRQRRWAGVFAVDASPSTSSSFD